MQGTTFLSFSSVSFGISFEHAVQLPFTVFLYSPFPDNYAFLSLSPSQIKNIQSADTVPVHGHSPLVCSYSLEASVRLIDGGLGQKQAVKTVMTAEEQARLEEQLLQKALKASQEDMVSE